MANMPVGNASSYRDLFDVLNAASVKYAVLRDVDQQLQRSVPITSDIDLIVHPNDRHRFYQELRSIGYVRNKHPWDFGHNFVFLYGMTPFDWFVRAEVKVDIAYELSCRSLNRGEWIPLHADIQESVWATRKPPKNNTLWWTLSPENELVHLVTRAIFDKKGAFNDSYIRRIQCLLALADIGLVASHMQQVVFKFTPKLMKMLEEEKFSAIRTEFIRFSDY